MVDKYIQGLIDREPPDSPVKYQFLDRMRFDCNYLTGDSGPKYRIGDFLWADNVEDQIDNMKALWNSFSEEGKPEWLSMEQIDKYKEQLVEMSNKSRYGIDYAGISQLYVWESRWADFFKLLQENATLDRVVEAEQYLADSYPMELAAMYRDLILGYMERQMGREHYQSACRYIRRMIKLGARLMAVGLIERLRKLYPARRAMLEELAKI